MKKWLALLLLCLLFPSALAEEGQAVVYNRTDNLTEEFVFPEGTPLLEIIFPRVFSSDCAVIRFGDEVMMIDASSRNETMQHRIQTALQSAGIDHIDVAYNSHPHNDHIDGFIPVDEACPIGQMILTFEEDYDFRMKNVVKHCNESGIPIVHAGDGDVLTMGEHGEVTMRVIQRCDLSTWKANDRSAMLLIQYGERTILFSGDVEERAQASYCKNPPEGGLKADILKYPHHGQVKLVNDFMQMIDPELTILTGGANVMDDGKRYLEKSGIPYLTT